jgi:hypothetical protein
MSTYRERRLRKAERLRDWADKRERDASATFREHEKYRGDHAFNFQPGHIPERARVIAREDRAHASMGKAADMAARADEIERQADAAIYDDDPDAIKRLRAKLAALEAKRDRRKAANAAYRKEHRVELKAMSAYDRAQAVPFPSYSITNLTGNIGRTRDRLARLEREKVSGPRDRYITARYGGECADCGAAIERGDLIRYSRAAGARCRQCPDKAAII